jgi:hypothetical protein
MLFGKSKAILFIRVYEMNTKNSSKRLVELENFFQRFQADTAFSPAQLRLACKYLREIRHGLRTGNKKKVVKATEQLSEIFTRN